MFNSDLPPETNNWMVFCLIQVGAMSEKDKRCCLTLDELSIKTELQYDSSTGTILGNVTLPDHPPTPSTKGLVFMLSGLCTRWKQIVAYYYTGLPLCSILSFPCAFLKPVRYYSYIFCYSFTLLALFVYC